MDSRERRLRHQASSLGIELYRGIPGYQVHHLKLDVWWPDVANMDLDEVEALIDGYEGVGRVWAVGHSSKED
jgi:hypothetical protein